MAFEPNDYAHRAFPTIIPELTRVGAIAKKAGN